MWDQEYKRKKPIQEVAPSKLKKLDIEIPDVSKAIAGADQALSKPKLGAPPNHHPFLTVLKYRLAGMDSLGPEEQVYIKALTGKELSAEERAWAAEWLCSCFGEDGK